MTDFQTFTVKVPASWVQLLQKLARDADVTPEQFIVGALGEELGRAENDRCSRGES